MTTEGVSERISAVSCARNNVQREHFASAELKIGTDSIEAFEICRKINIFVMQCCPDYDPSSAAFAALHQVKELTSYIVGTGFLDNRHLAGWLISILFVHVRSGGTMTLQLDIFRTFLLQRKSISDDGNVAPHLRHSAGIYPHLTRFFIGKDEPSRRLTELCHLCCFYEKSEAAGDDLISLFMNPLRGNEYRRYFFATLFFFLKDKVLELYRPVFRDSLFATMLFLFQYFRDVYISSESYGHYAAKAVTPNNDVGNRIGYLFDELSLIVAERRFHLAPRDLFEKLCSGYQKMLGVKKMTFFENSISCEVYLDDVFARMLREEAGGQSLYA